MSWSRIVNRSHAYRDLLKVWLVCLAMSVLFSPASAREPATAQEVADRIDAIMQKDWSQAQVTPAPRSDDGEFLRRIYLHLNGTIPDVATVRRFLADDSSMKRSREIDDCLDSAAYCTHFAEIFNDVLLPDSIDNFVAEQTRRGFKIWMFRQLAQEARYNDIVQRIVTGVSRKGEQRNFFIREALSPDQFNQSGFYITRNTSPESLAAASMRYFLGVRIECAQCHDHPFDNWKQDQFWGIAAFFGSQTLTNSQGEVTFQIKVPNTDRTVSAAFLEDSPVAWKSGTIPQEALAEWMTSRENRRFSEAFVNRIWGHLFGRGLVHPVDDFYDGNPASHPEVLSLLADEFVRHDFDMKFVLRAITNSQTYQLSSRRTDETQDAPEMFARMAAQGLTAAQLENSIRQAVGASSLPALPLNQNGRVRTVDDLTLVQLFPNNSGSSQERESSILQSLLLMNSSLMSESVNPQLSGTLSAVINAPFLKPNDKVDTLFLATLTRYPTPAERERVTAFIKGESPKNLTLQLLANPGIDRQRGLAGLLWALLNSSEFCLNH